MTEQQLKNAINNKLWAGNVSQRELARRIGRDRKTIYNCLYDKTGTSVETLVDMCEALGLELVIREKEGAAL